MAHYNTKLEVLNNSVYEQLKLEHIETSFSDWNSPVLLFKKSQEAGSLFMSCQLDIGLHV